MALVKYNNNSLSSVTSAAGFPAGAMTLISTQTAASSANISFTSGIDSTYKEYQFHFTSFTLQQTLLILVFKQILALILVITKL